MMRLIRVVDPDGVATRCKRSLKRRAYRAKVTHDTINEFMP